VFKGKLIIWGILLSLSLYGAESQPGSLPPESHADQPIECFHSALEWGLSFHQSIHLCTNAKSQDPIQCFTHAPNPRTLDFTNDQKISLCQGATSEAPFKCFEESFDLDLTYDERTKLCNASVFRSNAVADRDVIFTAPVHCFIQSIVLSIPLTPDERVILCANADSDDPVRCIGRADILTLSFDQRVRLCTQLSPSSW
jgi:hypothetical protein